MSEDFVYAVNRSEIGKARCLNCGGRWGDHAGIQCQSISSGDHTFQPLGFALSDMCDCGKILLDHYKRVGCTGENRKDKVFKRYTGMFTDEEFLL